MTARFAAIVVCVWLGFVLVSAQGTAPQTPLVLVTRDGRTPVPTVLQGGDELMSLDDLAGLFKVTVREDTAAGGVRLTYRDRAIVATAGQPTVSVAGRVVTLPSAVVRAGGRWFVPVEFLPRALGPIYDRRIELRRASRILAVGDVRIARVTARVEAPGPPTRATIDVVPAFPVAITTDDGRVVVRVEADVLELNLPPGGLGLVRDMRATDRGSTLTVTLTDAAGAPQATPTILPERTRVTIDVPARVAAQEPTPAAPSPQPRPSAPSPDPLPLTTASTPGGPSGIRIVALDPGHGGDDAGARSAEGLEEKQVALDVARRLRTLLESRLGLRVVMTRDDDRFVAPDARTAIANASHADLLLSLHANAAFSADAAGSSVATRLEPDGVRAAGEAVALPAVGGATRTIEFVDWDHAQARHVDRAWTLATMVDESLRAQVPMASPSLRRLPLRSLAGANMPAVEVELAYLTNPEQGREAGTDAFQARLAQALFDAVARFASAPETQAP